MYPLPQLNIIAPIIFIVLICLIPLLGLLAGWKRAAFWGGGFLLFYIIGLIVWSIAGISISSKLSALITDLLNKMFPQLQIEEPLPAEFVKSVLTPFYFLVVMIIAWILLMINYYAWYKKVTGLRKVVVVDKKTKKKHKEFSKLNKNHDKKWYKAVYRLGGFAIMGATTFPTTLAFTQFAYVATTTTALRQENKLSNGVYEKLYPLASSGFSKVCYFKEDTLLDYDSLLSVVSMLGKTIDIEGEQKDILYVIENGIGYGVSSIFSSVAEMTLPSLKDPQASIVGDHEVSVSASIGDDFSFGPTWEKVEYLGKFWNPTLTQYQTEVNSIFKSRNVLPTVNSVIGPMILDWFGENVVIREDGNWIQNINIPVEIEITPGTKVTINVPYTLHYFYLLFCNGPLRQTFTHTPEEYDIGTWTIHLNLNYKPVFPVIISQYFEKVKAKEIEQLKQIDIPQVCLNSIVNLFNSFITIDDTYANKIKIEGYCDNPQEILNTNIGSFVQSVFIPY